MNTESKPKVSYLTEYIVVTGYSLLFCILITGCAGFYFLKNRSLFTPLSPRTNEFATDLPPSTPSPHVSSSSSDAGSILFQDDFSDNQNHWLNGEDDSKEKIDEGKLFFQSREEGDYSIISCDACPYNPYPFYLEAELATNIATDDDYGIAFRGQDGFDDFFLFVINPESKKYYLWHHAPGQWSLRSSGDTTSIHSYPESNTLGVYAKKDLVELYINGHIVDAYTETGQEFYPGYFGFYVNDSWYGVWVDNVISYKVRN